MPPQTTDLNSYKDELELMLRAIRDDRRNKSPSLSYSDGSEVEAQARSPLPVTTHKDKPVELLCGLIASNDSRYSERDFHRTVYDYIENIVLPGAPAGACPPLPVLVYTIRNILEPTFVPTQIPELVKILVHLEILRNKAVKLLEVLLEQRKVITNTSCLEEPRRRAVRIVYRKVIHACCLSHIHHLWRTYNPTSDPPLTSVLFEYYPAFAVGDLVARAECQRALQEQAIHHDLTEEEYAENRREGEKAAEFIVEAAKYTEDPEGYCNEHGRNGEETFDELFPPPNADGIVDAIMRFVTSVKLAVDTVDAHASE